MVPIVVLFCITNRDSGPVILGLGKGKGKGKGKGGVKGGVIQTLQTLPQRLQWGRGRRRGRERGRGGVKGGGSDSSDSAREIAVGKGKGKEKGRGKGRGGVKGGGFKLFRLRVPGAYSLDRGEESAGGP